MPLPSVPLGQLVRGCFAGVILAHAGTRLQLPKPALTLRHHWISSPRTWEMGQGSGLLAIRQGLAHDRRAPDGGSDGQADSRLDWNRRMGEIRAYLREAAESEGEGE